MLNENLALTNIVNSALVGIGNNAIEDLNDDNNGTAKICRMMLLQCIKEVQSHPSGCWDELLEWETLTRNTGDFKKDVYSYNLPNRCLCVKQVKTENGIDIPFKVFGHSLKTPKEAKFVCITRFSDSPDEWSPELQSCIIGLLSAKLIAAIVRDYNASRQAVEAFWTMEFPRWAGNRINKVGSANPGSDAELSSLWGESPQTSLHSPDWF